MVGASNFLAHVEGVEGSEDVVGNSEEEPGAGSEVGDAFGDAEDASVPCTHQGGDEGGECEGTSGRKEFEH